MTEPLGGELGLFARLAEAVAGTLDLGRILDVIVEEVRAFASADAAGIYLLDPERNVFVLRAARGLSPESIGRTMLAWREGLVGTAAAEGKVIAAPDAPADPRFAARPETGEGAYHGMLAAPLLVEGRVEGVLTLQTRAVRSFDDRERALLEAVAHLAGRSIHHARLFGDTMRLADDLARRVRELTIVHLVSRQLQGTVSIKEVLFILLTGITSGQGLGFNRALVLLTNPEARCLEGAMGIGPTIEEVDRVWRTAAATYRTLEDYFESIDIASIEHSPFHTLVRGISLPLAPDAPIPARAVVEARAFVVEDAERDPNVDRDFARRIRSRCFAVVPVVSKELVIGCVVVDNCFTRRPIEAHDVQLLTTLSNQAGLALESARLIAELNDAMKRLERTHEALAEAEKMAAIGEMAAGVAHDIRNPVTAIGGFARRLARRLGEGPESRYVEIILREAERLERISADVLLYARGGRAEAVETDLGDLVDGVVRGRAHDAAERGVELSLHREETPRLAVEPAAIEKAVTNLVQNALEATPAGGRVEVSVGGPPAGGVRIEVRDTGHGIAEADLPRLFEPFFTTKTKGTGLGLALVKKIVEAHGGTIGVQSAPGEGTVFTIVLPWEKIG